MDLEEAIKNPKQWMQIIYQLHMSTPLYVSKMLECQLVIKRTNALLSRCPRREPPSLDNVVFGIHFFLSL
jgi:hypothetical protein